MLLSGAADPQVDSAALDPLARSDLQTLLSSDNGSDRIFEERLSDTCQTSPTGPMESPAAGSACLIRRRGPVALIVH